MSEKFYVELIIILTNGHEDYEEHIIVCFANDELYQIIQNDDFEPIHDKILYCMENERGYTDHTIDEIIISNEYGNDWDDDVSPDIEELDTSILDNESSSDDESSDDDSY